MVHRRLIDSVILLAVACGVVASAPAMAASSPCVVRVCVASYGYHDASGKSVTVCSEWKEQIKINCKPIAIDTQRPGPKLPPTGDRKVR